MAHLGDLGAKGAGADVVLARLGRTRGQLQDEGAETREHPLPRALPQRQEPHRRLHIVQRLGVKEQRDDFGPGRAAPASARPTATGRAAGMAGVPVSGPASAANAAP